MNKIDAKGLLCPKPVILTKKALDDGANEAVETTVDNEVAVENLKKLAESMKCDYKTETLSDCEFRVTITKNDREKEAETVEEGPYTLAIANEFMGGGEDELGKILMKSFLYTVSETRPYPRSMVFFNSGVKLTTEGSESLEEIKKLEAEGVEIISCGTCLDYYELKEKLEVGSISNMYTIYEKLAVEKNLIIR
ncbi:MAG: sulfurtransferase-like selenium metabolism protein YedF [Gallicola sp.]|nr:sulfurtransferase-like selenium metabolism protein YedF [Gallicola sp.]